MYGPSGCFTRNLTPETRHILRRYSRESSSIVWSHVKSYFMTINSPIVVVIHGNGWFLDVGFSDCSVDVLVSLPHENWVCKASYHLTAFVGNKTWFNIHV